MKGNIVYLFLFALVKKVFQEGRILGGVVAGVASVGLAQPEVFAEKAERKP